jgi:hypothetical protein
MLRPFHAFCRKTVSRVRRHWRLVVLTLCALVIQTGAANALTAAPAIPALRIIEAAGPVAAQRVAYCERGRPCAEEEDDAPSRPYKVGPPIEVPCEAEQRPLPRVYTYRADPPGGYVERRAYEDEVVREESYCGVRCWYRRIREGHCGRGCDYYMFRLRHFPSGRFVAGSDQRVVCRTRW